MERPSFDRDVVVVGAGAAGLFAATEAALLGKRVLLIEKMKKAGIKILASGGTKCNVTSTLPLRELGLFFGKKAERFLRYGLHECSPQIVRQLLDDEGCATAEFPMEKVFPVSGRAGDVLRAFLRRLQKSGAELSVDEGLKAILPIEGGFELRTTARTIRAPRVIVTVGGRSYPKSGTTGDGYDWLKKLGLEVVATKPALVPLIVKQPWLRALTGIAVEDAVVESIDGNNRALFTRRRPVLFTHRGLSGPGAMDASSRLVPGKSWHGRLRIDWMPETERELIEARLMEAANRRQLVANVIPGGYPRRLLAGFMSAAGVPQDRQTSELRREERRALVEAFKAMIIEVDGDEGWDKAEVTAGGLSLDEVQSKTMEVKKYPGLFMAGEILDLDGPIGGFNFQAAFSTGTVAGRAAARFE